jgi:flagellar basal body-associated protein FliL
MFGNPALDKVILFLNLGIVLGGLGLTYFSHNMLKPPPIDNASQEQEFHESMKGQKIIDAIMMPKLTINLYSNTTRLRYLDVIAAVEPFSPSQAEKIKANQSLILNEIIEVSSFMRPKELINISGKIILAERIKERVNGQFSNKLIRNIYFPKYVIQ